MGMDEERQIETATAGPPANAEANLAPGSELGPYRIEGLLGVGGMGRVYKARDSRLGRAVAIKVCAARFSDRFAKEAHAIASLTHPHICTLYDVGPDFLVMELVEGENLADALRRGPLPLDRVLRHGREIAAALGAAHARGIVHRDLKPGNVMLTEHGAKVLDFGLEKMDIGGEPLTESNVVMGTPAYMAPEQAQGKATDARTDIFALGLMLFEMAMGKRPAAGRALDSPGLPGRFASLIERCIAPDPGARWQSASDVQRELDLLAIKPAPRRDVTWVVLAAVIGVLLVAAYWVGKRPVQTGNIQSLAVLPLENLSGDSSQDYFADGMTEVIITDLGQLPNIRVIARPPVMKFKGSRLPLAEIAAELKVDSLVVGSVARAGTQVRVTAQLYDARQGRQLWSNRYERDLRDVLTLQSELASAVAGEIRVQTGLPPPSRASANRAVNPEAYDAYLRSLFLYARHSYADNLAAIAAAERAVAIDPTISRAHAVLALADVERLFTFAPEENKKLEENAYLAVSKAITLDPDEPMAYFARGRLLWTPSNRFPHEKAILDYRRALALNPNLAEARAQLALTYNHVGLLDEALTEANAAASINPSDTMSRVAIAQALLYQGQYEKALSVWTKNPPDAYASVTASHTAWTLLQLNRTSEAEAKLGGFLKTSPGDVGGLGVKAAMLAVTNRKDEAIRIINQISPRKGFGHFHHTAYYIAWTYARLQMPEQALEWLRETAESGFPCFPLFDQDPGLSQVRQRPGWAPLRTELERNWLRYKALAAGKPMVH